MQHSHSDYSMMQDNISPRPSPQHSKSLTAPLDCSNCLKQQSNPINNFISKWKYKEDLAKPLNMKRTRPRKQPQTTYHFPLSHTSVNTFNPNNKQNESPSESSSPTQDGSPSPTETPETPSPRQQEPKEQEQLISPHSSPHSSPSSSPRLATRDALIKHRRALVQQYVDLHPKKHQVEGESLHHHHHNQQESCDQRRVQQNYKTSPRGQQGRAHQSHSDDHDTSRFMQKNKTGSSTRMHTIIPTPPRVSLEISSICHPGQDPMVSPHSSDNDEYSHIERLRATRCSRKRRSNGDMVMELDTIEISDDERGNDYPGYHSENEMNQCDYDDYGYDSSSSSSSSSFSSRYPSSSSSPRYLSSTSNTPRDLPSSASFSPRDHRSSPPSSSYSPRDLPASLSPRYLPSSNVHMHSPRETVAERDTTNYTRHPLSLHGGYSDLAKYHLVDAGRSPALPPLNLARLPSIDELPWPMDDGNTRLHNHHHHHHHHHQEPILNHRSQSFPCHYSWYLISSLLSFLSHNINLPTFIELLHF